MKETGKNNPRPTEDDVPPIVKEIQRRMGEVGIHGYTDLPRKSKKAAKKLALGKALTQRELARLESIRRRESGN